MIRVTVTALVIPSMGPVVEEEASLVADAANAHVEVVIGTYGFEIFPILTADEFADLQALCKRIAERVRHKLLTEAAE